MGQLSPQATTTEPMCLESMLHNKRSHRNKKPAHRDESVNTHLMQLEKAWLQQRPSAPKDKVRNRVKEKTKLTFMEAQLRWEYYAFIVKLNRAAAYFSQLAFSSKSISLMMKM